MGLITEYCLHVQQLLLKDLDGTGKVFWLKVTVAHSWMVHDKNC